MNILTFQLSAQMKFLTRTAVTMKKISSVETEQEFPQCEGNTKKRKYQLNETFNLADDFLPFQFCHICNGPRSVKPEIYKVATILSSSYHMSQSQVQGAIITVANELFGRKEFGEWKVYSSTEPQDDNTLPSFNNVRRAEHYFEAMALNMVVEEIMEDGNDATVVYSNDGSVQSGVGKYIVQSLTVNGVKRVFTAFGIFTES